MDERKTQQEVLRTTWTTWTAKQPYKMTHIASGSVIEASATSMSTEQTHQIEIKSLEAIEASRRRWRMSRVFRTAKRSLTTLNKMVYIVDVRGIVITSKWMHHVELGGQEANWASRRRMDILRAILAEKLMTTFRSMMEYNRRRTA